MLNCGKTFQCQGTISSPHGKDFCSLNMNFVLIAGNSSQFYLSQETLPAHLCTQKGRIYATVKKSSLGDSAISMLKWHDLVRLPSPRLNPSLNTERSGTPVPNEIRWAWRNRPPNPTHKSPNIATCLPIKYLVNTVTYEINLRVCFIVTLT